MKIKIPYYSSTGTAKEPVELEVPEKFSKVSPELLSQAIHVENNNLMIKAGRVKTKGEVRGGGRKPWKQKGTGRARAGSNRSPLWRGGGITFGPTGINRVLEIPKKMRELAMLSLIIHKAQEKDLAIIEDLKIESGKTKDADKVLKKVNDSKYTVLAIDEESVQNVLPWRNLALINIKRKESVALSDLNSKKKIVFTKKSFDYFADKVKNG